MLRSCNGFMQFAPYLHTDETQYSQRTTELCDLPTVGSEREPPGITYLFSISRHATFTVISWKKNAEKGMETTMICGQKLELFSLSFYGKAIYHLSICAADIELGRPGKKKAGTPTPNLVYLTEVLFGKTLI